MSKGSHGRKRPEGYVGRSPNAFMLFRSELCEKQVVPSTFERKQQNLSIVAGNWWRCMPSEEKSKWQALAKVKREEHEQEHPNYKYKPEKRDTVRRRRRATTKEEQDAHCQNLTEMFVPAKVGPLLQHPGSKPTKKRTSRTKVRSTDAAKPARPPRARVRGRRRAAPVIQDVVDPLLSPSMQPDVGVSYFDKRQDIDLDTVSYNLPHSTPRPVEELTHPVHLNAPSELIDQRGPPDAVPHIPENSDMGRWGATSTTMAIHTQDPEAFHGLDLFFSPNSTANPAPMQSRYVPLAEREMAWPENNDSECYDESMVASGSSSDIFSASGFEHFDALFDQSTFPMTFPVSSSTSLEPLQLRPPEFDAPQDPFDTLTFSFDSRTLDAPAEHLRRDDIFEQVAGKFDVTAWSNNIMMKDIISLETEI